jgi:lysophospholipase L1-like esterase
MIAAVSTKSHFPAPFPFHRRDGWKLQTKRLPRKQVRKTWGRLSVTCVASGGAWLVAMMQLGGRRIRRVRPRQNGLHAPEWRRARNRFMKNTLIAPILAAVLGVWLARPALAENTATNPVPRDAHWLARHEAFVRQAQQGGMDVLFLGDSITDFWRTRGSNVWNRYYAPLHAANFGISGDRTQHLLWRIDHGELDGIHPKVVVLMIGTNNTGKERDGQTIRNTVPEVIQGIQAVVADIRSKLPESKILLLGIFPRGNLDDPQRAQVAVINTVIAKLDDGRRVYYLDLTPHFLEPDGSLSRAIMPDLLHPSERGYEIWAEAMQPTLEALLKN